MPRPGFAVVVAAVGIALAGCGQSGSAAGAAKAGKLPSAGGTVFTDARFGFNFRYPKQWRTGDFSYDAAHTTGVHPAASVAIGIDRDNSVLLTRYNLVKAVTAQDLPEQLVELNGVISRFAGRPSVGQPTELGGMPGVRYQAFALPGDPAERRSRVAFVFDGAAQYELNCQSTPKARAAMDLGCDQMLATLRRN